MTTNKHTLAFLQSAFFEKIFLFAFKVILGISLIFLISKGCDTQPDSGSYLGGSLVRYPLYPLFLKFNHYLFNSNNFVLAFMQVLIGYISCYFISYNIKSMLRLNNYIFSFLFIIFLIPYFSIFIGNYILSEAIAYPLFLLAITFLLRGFFNKSDKNFYLFLFFTILLNLTRGQFVFLYLIYFMVIFYDLIKGKHKFLCLKLCVLGLIALGLNSTLERGYQYFKTGEFKTTPFTGFHLITAPLFISQEADKSIFTDPLQYKLFIEMHEELSKKGLLKSSLTKPGEIHLTYTEKFMIAFDNICYGVVSPAFSKFGVSNDYEAEKIKIQMAIKLIKRHPIDWIVLYFKNVAKNFSYPYFLLISALLFISFISLFFFRNKTIETHILFSLINIGNYCTIAVVHHPMFRYTLYTDFIQIASFIIIWQFFMEKIRKDKAMR